MPGRPGTNVPSVPAAAEVLGVNYQISFSATSEGKSVGELSMLTCSPDISVSGPLNSGATPTSFTVRGSLSEKDDELLFRYGINFSVPITTSALTSKQDGQAIVSNIQYQEHNSQGMLRMKAGTPYEVLKAGGAIYTITITPVPKK